MVSGVSMYHFSGDEVHPPTLHLNATCTLPLVGPESCATDAPDASLGPDAPDAERGTARSSRSGDMYTRCNRENTWNLKLSCT